MAYTPHTWECGELVTPEKLNHIEQGIADCCGGGVLSVNIVSEVSSERCADGKELTFDHTWQEMRDAMVAGMLVLITKYTEIPVGEGGGETVEQFFVFAIEAGDSYSIYVLSNTYREFYTFDSPTDNVGYTCAIM